MNMSSRGRNLLAEWEGVRLIAYDDAGGNQTIGVGHLLRIDEKRTGELEIDGRRVPWRGGITREDAMELLGVDLRWVESTVTNHVKVPLEQHEFDALCSFAFNVGVNAFLDSALRYSLNAGNRAAVPTQLMRWVNAGGVRINGLVTRRMNEVALWEGRL